jgi:cell division protein FtsB
MLYTKYIVLDKINIEKLTEPYIEKGKAYLLSLRDVRNVGMLVFVVIVLLISWSGIKTIQTNYGLQKQIATLRQENDVQNLQNTNLQLQNQYYNTDQYLEITARENFGLGSAGETELLVPKDVALAHTAKQSAADETKQDVPKQPFWQRNFEAWMDFFLHRGTAE